MRFFLMLVMVFGIGLDALILIPQFEEQARRPASKIDLVGPGFVTVLFVVLPWIALSRRRGAAAAAGPRRARARIDVPICYENDVPMGSPYIQPSGERHIVRVRQVEPPDCEYLEDLDGDDSFMVAGISHRQWVVGEILGGRRISVAAVREPENKKDRNAIRIDASWLNGDGEQREATVGYIQATVAAAIAKTYEPVPLECMVDVIFAPRKGMTAGMRVHLLIHQDVKAKRRRKLRTE